MSSGIQYQALLFQSTELTVGPHTLVITILSDSPNQILYLDFFVVTSSPPPSTTVILSSTQVVSSTQVFSSTEVTTATIFPSGTISHVVSSAGTASHVVSSKPALGPIIGGVLGALALLTIAFIAFLFFRWKSKDHLHHRESNSDGDGK